jgi:hypothetical protein
MNRYATQPRTVSRTSKCIGQSGWGSSVEFAGCSDYADYPDLTTRSCQHVPRLGVRSTRPRTDRLPEKPRAPGKTRDLASRRRGATGRRRLRQARFTSRGWTRRGCPPHLGPGDFAAWHKGTEVPSHGASLFQVKRSAECWHRSTAAFHEDGYDLSVRSGRLPPRVGEIRYIWDVPDAATVDPVTTDAVSIVQAHDDTLLLVGAPHPVPLASPPVWRIAAIGRAT